MAHGRRISFIHRIINMRRESQSFCPRSLGDVACVIVAKEDLSRFLRFLAIADWVNWCLKSLKPAEVRSSAVHAA